eukprot:316892-Chlamydomonas_euryale.AAC.1
MTSNSEPPARRASSIAAWMCCCSAAWCLASATCDAASAHTKFGGLVFLGGGGQQADGGKGALRPTSAAAPHQHPTPLYPHTFVPAPPHAHLCRELLQVALRLAEEVGDDVEALLLGLAAQVLLLPQHLLVRLNVVCFERLEAARRVVR